MEQCIYGKLNREIIEVGIDQNLANANPQDVVEGKTFIANGSKDVQVGTLNLDAIANQAARVADIVIFGGTPVSDDQGDLDQLEIESLYRTIMEGNNE